MDYGYIDEIYRLLNQYLPTISTNNATQATNSTAIAKDTSLIRQLLAELKEILVGVAADIGEFLDISRLIQLDIETICKYLLWFLFAFLTTKMIKWGNRI